MSQIRWLSCGLLLVLATILVSDISEVKGYDSWEVDSGSSESGSYEGHSGWRRGWRGRAYRCFDRRQSGHCSGHRERWYYSRQHRECRSFTYSGCGGNGNNFRSRRHCERRCERHGRRGHYY